VYRGAGGLSAGAGGAGAGGVGAAGLAMTGYNLLALLVAACTLLLLGVSLLHVGKRPQYGIDGSRSPGGRHRARGRGNRS
jgi:hypothetical protein